MVYIVAEIVTKHIKQQLILKFWQKTTAEAQSSRAVFV